MNVAAATLQTALALMLTLTLLGAYYERSSCVMVRLDRWGVVGEHIHFSASLTQKGERCERVPPEQAVYDNLVVPVQWLEDEAVGSRPPGLNQALPTGRFLAPDRPTTIRVVATHNRTLGTAVVSELFVIEFDPATAKQF